MRYVWLLCGVNRVGGGEDPVGGMGAALVGLMKNDKIIIGVPTGILVSDEDFVLVFRWNKWFDSDRVRLLCC